MPAINKNTLGLFLASSAATVTLFSQFEPTLARFDRKSALNKDISRVLKKKRVLSSRRNVPQRQTVGSGVYDYFASSVAGTLKNAVSETFENKVREGQECDPDLGILSCKEGEYCKKVYVTNGNDHPGGVCISKTVTPPDEQDGVRKLEEKNDFFHRFLADCDPETQVEVELYIEYDAFSANPSDPLYGNATYDNTYAIIDNSTGVYLYSGQFPILAPVNNSFCFTPSDDLLKLFIYDEYGDGISYQVGNYTVSGGGLSLGLPNATEPFFSLDTLFFTGDYAYEYEVCFKCPGLECCFPADCATGDNLSDIICQGVGSPPEAPVSGPTEAPVSGPTEVPVSGPTEAPVSGPTEAPVSGPTEAPVDPGIPAEPTEAPVSGPTDTPVSGPTEAPVSGPTDVPVSGPTEAPVDVTEAPVEAPVASPVASPVSSPVSSPTEAPVIEAIPAPPTSAPTTKKSAKKGGKKDDDDDKDDDKKDDDKKDDDDDDDDKDKKDPPKKAKKGADIEIRRRK